MLPMKRAFGYLLLLFPWFGLYLYWKNYDFIILRISGPSPEPNQLVIAAVGIFFVLLICLSVAISSYGIWMIVQNRMWFDKQSVD